MSTTTPTRTLLAIIDTTQLSGPGRQLTALLGALPAAGYDVELVTFQRSGRPVSPLVAHAEGHGIRVTVIPERGPVDPAQYRALRAHLALRQPTIVQTHSYKATALVWLLRRTGLRFGWVGCFHGSTAENLKVRAYHRLDQLLLRAADRIVLMAESQRAGLGGAGPRATVISNAVLPPTGSPDAPAPSWNAGLTRPVLACLGRLSHEKGVDLLLRAAALVANHDPHRPWSLVIAGDGPEREPLNALASSLGVASRVHFIGHLEDPWTLYRRCDAVIIPSRSEGLPNVLLEAIAADLPVIATRVGAIPDVIGTSAAAALVPPDDVEALANAIETCLTEPADPAGAEDRATLRAAYSLERRVAAHLEIYRALG